MHRNLRRKDREISVELATKLFSEGEYGFLCTADNNGQPYGIPLNYVYKNTFLYFHCALEGHKLENIEANKKVSFCVVGRTKTLPDKFATQYESALAFGTASEVFGSEKQDVLLSFLGKYSLGFLEEGKAYIEKMNEKARVIKINIDHITGKARE
jgi:uncharacterized protein